MPAEVRESCHSYIPIAGYVTHVFMVPPEHCLGASVSIAGKACDFDFYLHQGRRGL